ncbi:MAG: hypothetical protein JSU97_00005, partial [Dehalococcoidia bacterium]
MWTKTRFSKELLLGASVLLLLGALAVAALVGSVGGWPSGGVALADRGDFSLDFIAAQHDTYYHAGPDEGNEIGPSEGQDLGYDDRTSNVDVKEELEASDFACGDRIVFFTAVTVDASATDTDQTIFLVYHFDAHNNGQQGVGYEEVLDVGISAVDFPPPSQTGDDGNIGLDGGETVTLVSQQYLPVGSVFGDPIPANRADVLEAVVKVTGLDPGEQLIVRADVRFSCFASPVTGNLHAAISEGLFDADGDGVFPDPDDENISVGQQDVPMLGLGQIPDADVEKVSLTVGTPDAITGECTGPAPTDINASQDETICTRQVIRNNGPADPVDVVDTLTLTAPPGCTIIPSDPVVWVVSLPAGVDVSRDDNFAIHCSQASNHVFTFEDEVVITTEGITDSNPDNNVAIAQLSVNVWAEADVKIVDQYFAGAPTEIDVSVETPLTVQKVLHNNGPYPADVTVTLSTTAAAPADCTMSP